jgi:uncharacterized membrane protein YbjE (DUF340 family)
METVQYLITLFAFLGGGMLSVKIGIIPMKAGRQVDISLSLCLYVLLFFMGVRTGLIEDLWNQLGTMGGMAVSLALFTSMGSASVVVLAGCFVRKRRSSGREHAENNEALIAAGGRKTRRAAAEKTGKSFSVYMNDQSQKGIESFYNENATGLSSALSSPSNTESAWKSLWKHLKEPARLIGLVVIGTAAAAATSLFSWFHDAYTNWLLYILLFLVGAQMIQSSRNMLAVMKNPISIMLPLLTVLGTMIGGSLTMLLYPLRMGEALAMASGFGWYSLSGVLIADLGSPVLGSAAFLSNLFRESIAFITIPLFASYNQKHAAISIAGATSMDVTLPIVEHSCGADFAPLSLAHGIVLTIFVPFLVPVLFQL